MAQVDVCQRAQLRPSSDVLCSLEQHPLDVCNLRPIIHGQAREAGRQAQVNGVLLGRVRDGQGCEPG